VLAVEQPRSVDVWTALAAARRASGDVEGAEQALRAALQIAPLQPELHARLGDLLVEGYGGRRDDDAVLAYRRAVRDGSTDAGLWWRTAQAERRAGEWELAVDAADRALKLAPDAEFAADAARWIAGAHRTDPPAIVLPPVPPDDGLSAEARRALALAAAWRQRKEPGSLDRALEEVARAAELAPDAVAPLNLEAELWFAKSQPRQAFAALEESLRRDPDQPEVLVAIGRHYELAGRTADAEASWARAASLGAPAALWRQARAEAGAGGPFAARRTLATFFSSTAGGPEYDDAVALSAQVESMIRSRYVLGGGLALFALAVPAWVVASTRWGKGLDGLLAAAPGTWRDVARILSAIRHEVLRHHAASFDDVANAIEAGDADVGRWLAAQWFGGGGALERFDGYVAELRSLARAAGVPLRLAARDPLFRPLLAAMDRLRAIRGALEHGTRQAHVAAELRAVSAVLDGEIMPALGRTIAGLCLLEVDRALLVGVVDAVLREPAFQGDQGWRPTVEALPSEPLVVRMFRADLTDVLTNLVRNAAEATRGQTGPRVSIAVSTEEDAVTGLARVEIRVRDASPRRLSTATVRGRFVGRGLGLAVDLTTRAGGSISVEDEAGWGKAVVVRLPRAEPEEEA
jgi:tetratricopeptide (TPR) repeat protein/signal transduction histidine kinase